MCSFDGVKEDEEKSGLYSADHLEMRVLFSWFPTQKRPENRLKTGPGSSVSPSVRT